jgi:hypothetical protein
MIHETGAACVLEGQRDLLDRIGPPNDPPPPMG